MLKFPKIHAFHQVVRDARSRGLRGPIDYRGTVKLHGTNAGVSVSMTDSAVRPQSRNRVISRADDHQGFAAFVDERSLVFRQIADWVRMRAEHPSLPGEVVLFGEWIGAGIQRGVAVAELQRQWVMFGAAVVCDGAERFVDMSDCETIGWDDDPLLSLVQEGAPGFDVTIDLSDPASCSDAVALVSEVTRDVEARCPWAASRGVDGIGEGLVWVPRGELVADTRLWFKSKGGLHKGESAARAPATLSAQQHAGIDAFVASVVNEARVRQGLEVVVEAGGSPTMASTGAFLRWLADDVKAENSDELDASGLTWKQVAKPVNSAAMTIWKRVLEQS